MAACSCAFAGRTTQAAPTPLFPGMFPANTRRASSGLSKVLRPGLVAGVRLRRSVWWVGVGRPDGAFQRFAGSPELI
ncbi:uncharacterized protein BO66DRAFT_389962 [Aspergillus aculeatinus CBS 121060]|uniref:Uncharacterized protein n=1 Tax=Aspergillus aculeatinus CBS 121060 TaxID=1448322 RepID=A0ACD1HFK1_9EURO|nr:hypothetical protein BO66DRAFT_389962 [Aspergillus aculeatinus CBS 121060]RAH72255.1 hypothetical protein BO66DRAFT_389962 [Aspergillus aculeatinus CBS 121060]